MIQSVCFDLDDTLYDYQQYARAGLRSAADLLEERTGERYHEELLTLHFDDDVDDGTFDVLVERHDLSEELIDDLIDAYHSSTSPLTPYAETESILSRLEQEYRLGLITDGRGGHAKLDRLGIRAYFDAVLVTPTIDRSKHDPVVFDRVLAELSVPPSTAVYVGDDPRVDFRIPNELQMTTVRLRRGRYTDLEPDNKRATPDYQISFLDDLPRVIERCDRDTLSGKRA